MEKELREKLQEYEIREKKLIELLNEAREAYVNNKDFLVNYNIVSCLILLGEIKE